eukprot:scaffold56628_cov31-Tisochrysis_lutea.AAC.1
MFNVYGSRCDKGTGLALTLFRDRASCCGKRRHHSLSFKTGLLAAASAGSLQPAGTLPLIYPYPIQLFTSH